MVDELEDSDAKPSFFRRTWASYGAGFLSGITAGGTIARLFRQEAEVPIKTLDWIVDHGITGFALVGMCVFGWVAWQEITKRERQNKVVVDAQKQRVDDAERHAAKIESVLREPMSILKKLGRLITLNTEVIRGHVVTQEELEALRDADETPDRVPLPPKGRPIPPPDPDEVSPPEEQ